MKKAIVVGASSGIGRELAVILSREGYALGLAARRLNLLEELRQELGGQVYIRRMDISQPEEAVSKLEALIGEMGGIDLLILCSGTGHINPDLIWEDERDTIDVNVRGFSALACAGMRCFIRQGFGHLVGISSLAALRGSGGSPAYNASKAYMSNYLEGLACKARVYGKGIAVTDIKPGFVDTAMAQGEGLFWVAPAQMAAKQIYRLIKLRRLGGYVTRRWGIIAFLFRILPRRLYMLLDSGSERAKLRKEKNKPI